MSIGKLLFYECYFLRDVQFTGCPEIDEWLVLAVISPPTTAGRVEFYRGPAPEHLTVSGGHMTPHDP